MDGALESKFMLPLKPGALIDWTRAQELYAEARRNKSFPRFGYGIRVSTAEFPDLEDLRRMYGFRDYFFILWQSPRQREVPIHVDGAHGNSNCASINWPLLNCDEASPTEWYSCEEPRTRIIEGSYFLENVEDARVVHREAMLSKGNFPYLFRSDVWHRGYSNSSGVRVILKWELIRDSWADTVLEFERKNLLLRG